MLLQLFHSVSSQSNSTPLPLETNNSVYNLKGWPELVTRHYLHEICEQTPSPILWNMPFHIIMASTIPNDSVVRVRSHLHTTSLTCMKKEDYYMRHVYCRSKNFLLIPLFTYLIKLLSSIGVNFFFSSLNSSMSRV